MRYNLRIEKSRYTGKTIAECCDIIAARADKINAACRMPAGNIILELRSLDKTYRRAAYYGNNGKVFVSINRTGA